MNSVTSYHRDNINLNFYLTTHKKEGFDITAIRHIVKAFIHFGTSGRNRTCDRPIRSGMLYSAELRKHIFVGVVGLEPTMSEDGRFTVSCNSRYATPQYFAEAERFELSEPFGRLHPLAEGWFRPLTHTSFCLTLQSYIAQMQPICVARKICQKFFHTINRQLFLMHQKLFVNLHNIPIY